MDAFVRNEGTISLLTPQTKRAVQWVNEKIGETNGYQPYWPTVVIEHRYVWDVVQGMRQDGLQVEERQ